jgi:hypothetical protein
LLRRSARGGEWAPFCAAAINALTILGGQHQAFIWQNLVLGVYAALLALQRRSLQPVRSLLVILAWTVGFGAVKLLPMWVEFSDYHPTAHTVGMPVRALFDAFAGRGQGPDTLFSGLEFTRGAGWWEYAFYFGPVAFVCFAAAMFSLRRTWPWIAIGGFFAWIAVDAPAGLDVWARITDLPVWRTQRSPSRFLFVASFAFLVAGAVGLERFHRFGRERSPRVTTALFAVLATLTFVDLRVESGPWQAGAIGSEIDSLTHHPRRRELRSEPPAVATLREFAPNRLVYRVVASEDTRVVLPIRYAKGARAHDRAGEDPGAAEWDVAGGRALSDDGKLAVEVPRGEHDIELRYRPRMFRTGAAVSVASLCGFAWLFRRKRARERPPPPPN